MSLPGLLRPRGEEDDQAQAHAPAETTYAAAAERGASADGSVKKSVKSAAKPKAAAKRPAATAAESQGARNPDDEGVGRQGRPDLEFGGSRKVSVGMRTYPAIWDAYAALAGELSSQGRGRVYQGDLINAVLSTCLPETPDAARQRLADFRSLLDADPPSDARSL